MEKYIIGNKAYALFIDILMEKKDITKEEAITLAEENGLFSVAATQKPDFDATAFMGQEDPKTYGTPVMASAIGIGSTSDHAGIAELGRLIHEGIERQRQQDMRPLVIKKYRDMPEPMCGDAFIEDDKGFPMGKRSHAHHFGGVGPRGKRNKKQRRGR